MNAPSPASVDAVPDLRRDPKSPDSLRILVVATTFPRWKNDHEPRFVFDLCRHLAKKVPLWVLAPHAGGAAFEEEIEGVRVIRFPYFYPRPLQTLCYGGGILPNLKSRWTARFQVPFFLAAQGFFLWKTVRRLQVNLIHCHWIVPQGFFTAWIHVFLRIPYLLTAHGGDVYAFQGHPLVRPLSRFALKRAGMCTVGSRASQKAIRSLSPRTPIREIPMGVDAQQFHPDKSDESLRKELGIADLFLLAVGRFAEKKGFRYLLQALPRVLEKRPQTQLVLIGFGPQEKELKSLSHRLRLQHAVQFPGSRSGEALARYFATADLFVGPSVVTESGDTEGQGVVFLEAMASGTAVIASDVGGVRDVVQDFKTGCLVPQKDPAALADKILLLAGNPALRQDLVRNGRDLVEKHYAWETIAESFLDAYFKVGTPPGKPEPSKVPSP